MASPEDSTPPPTGPDDETAPGAILGYLNFSNGTPDVRFQQNLNRLHELLTLEQGQPLLRRRLEERLSRLRAESAAFQDSRQAEAVLALVFDHVLPAYVRFHADLLGHMPEAEWYQPFFVARAVEAVLEQGAPWEDIDRIITGSLDRLNDFLGHRPVAVLENGREMQPYPHERFRPIPLYLKGAGTAAGRYHDLIEESLVILGRMPADILGAAYFDRELMDELALDVRAYDHSHPVYKRTNYTFGEWDPHCLDISGRYRRFVVRAVILDALRDWMEKSPDVPDDERLCEAAAVLAGTMLMASSVSGSGPDTHDSNVSLTSLLPRIARQRDAFYTRLLSALSGKHGERLRKEAKQVQQPFGRIRQHLNLYLAHYGCRQMQRAQLAFLYARLGSAEAARAQASIIPSAATRFETEMQVRLTQAQLDLERGRIAPAAEACAATEDLLLRGIDCGALADPWGILGFQGQFPLFAAREDSVPDTRVEKLLALMDQYFNVLSRLACEAAAAGDRALGDAVAVRFQRVAEFWDRFATTTVTDLPAVHGGESLQSAARVTRALSAWHQAGESAGDVAFWKEHVDEFQSARSYAIVVELLLRKRDVLAAMNLMIQWLSQSASVPLESGAYSFFALLPAWVEQATRGAPQAGWPLVRRFFDAVEANAGDWGAVPALQKGPGGALYLTEASATAFESPRAETASAASEFPESPRTDEDRESPDADEESPFSAAYENMVYRDSAQDGHEGDTLDTSSAQYDSDIDLIIHPIETRLRFLVTLSQAWSTAAEWALVPPAPVRTSRDESPASRIDAVQHWRRQNETLIQQCHRLMDDLGGWNPSEPDGDPDSLAEFDRQSHGKFALVNSVISAGVVLHDTSRALTRLIPPAALPAKRATVDVLSAEVLRSLSAGDADAVRRRLPRLLRELARLPLLYVPLDRDGSPRDILAARNLQSLLRHLLSRLPRLGLYRETWHLLRTAYVMERTAPPGGMSITEFDRLLEAALQSTLECLIAASREWQPRPASDARLVETIEQVLDIYVRLWLKHSATMRLSSAEALKEPGMWRRVRAFIRKYGSDLFHPRMLTMGNLRGIIQRGAEAYLSYLSENQDPLHPVRLLDDLGHSIEREEAAELLETILRCLVEKFDRFLEYNTTTTQSDYGEQLHCLLDFLRLESDYERQAWNLAPAELAHEVLSRQGCTTAAALWQQDLAKKTSSAAKAFLQKLRRMERQHAMRLPSVTDRLGERFVKPLALDRILALVRPAMRAARNGGHNKSFERLAAETEEYLSTTSGSALELQPWLQSLADEVQLAETEMFLSETGPRATSDDAPVPVTLDELQRQLEIWEKPLDGSAASPE